MTRAEQLDYLIHYLMPQLPLPKSEADKWKLFRSLVNTRKPAPISSGFLNVQDAFLKKEMERKGIVDITALTPVQNRIFLWKGDIATLQADSIVNAANSGMTGFYCPCHGCIDNAIHTFAGVQLRLECANIMEAQGYPEPAGQAKITRAYNLPASYVIHTVGPYVDGPLTLEHKKLLISCYQSCLKLADEKGITSIALSGRSLQHNF